ncbi:hypothetical protein A2Z22_00480 [Candidatus Woesebacteria bacterium RBG_16_34_12]|uniref:Uncharacterized protein n=1 Tax=Candidatus Woesebacteria bacterium RBG_16_34_12 TaxID=1802480 RepID=A0A1F7X920_9BACT|nr:MAG: hypothetical protein A2Z22_00480 [Candidatus Woesebacteria bacterium RBG_16_34_12]
MSKELVFEQSDIDKIINYADEIRQMVAEELVVDKDLLPKIWYEHIPDETLEEYTTEPETAHEVTLFGISSEPEAIVVKTSEIIFSANRMLQQRASIDRESALALATCITTSASLIYASGKVSIENINKHTRNVAVRFTRLQYSRKTEIA